MWLSCAAALVLGCSTSEDAVPTAASLRAAPAKAVPLSLAGITVRNDGGVARFEGAQLASEPGRPQLPVQAVRVLVDPDADLRKLVVELEDAKEEDVPGTFQVQPGMPMASNGQLRWPPGANIVDGKDIDVYGRDALFPASSVARVTPGRLHRFNVVEVLVFPYRWNPKTGALRVLVSGRLVVRVAPGAAAVTNDGAGAAALDARHSARLAKLVVNLDAELGKYQAATSASGVEVRSAALTAAAANGYAIITTGSLSNNAYLAKFADLKMAQGFSVVMVTQTTAYLRKSDSTWGCLTTCHDGWGGGIGDTAADGIRAWLKSNYVTQKLAHVLLVGNPDPVAGDVPMKLTWPNRFMSENGESVPTDAYYAELSGTWDFDGDGYFGEGNDDAQYGDPDRYSELSVGRIPFYGDVGALNHILAKTIAYETAAPADIAWRKNALLAMKPMDTFTIPTGDPPRDTLFQTPTYMLGEWIRSEYLVPSGWSSTRIYDRGFGVAPEITPCTLDTVESAWRSTPRGLVVWMSHGSWGGSAEIITTDGVAQLEDAHPSITFAVSCSTAKPEEPGNLTYSLLKNGAVAAVGAARDGYYSGISPEYAGPTGGEAYASIFTKHLVTRNETVGDAYNAARIEAFQDWADGVIFSVLGDPSVSMGSSGSGAGIGRPAAPSSPFAEGGNGFVKVSWSSVPEASTYLVQRATTAGGPYTVAGTTSATSYTDATAVDGTTYYYVVSGRGPGGDGPISTEVAGTPSTPMEVQYQVGDTNPRDNIIRPVLRVVNSGTTSVLLPSVNLTYYFTADNPGDLVFHCESATVGCENVFWSIQNEYSPAADRFLLLAFAWGPSLAPGESSEVRGYISRADSLTFDETNDYSYDAGHTTFAANRRVLGRIDSVLVWGSEPPYVTPVFYPQYLMGVPGNGQVSLSWAAVNGASGYNVYRSGGGAARAKIAFVQGLEWVDRGLTNGVAYSYDVTSVGSAGNESGASSPVTASPTADVPTSPPAAPFGLTATVENGAARFYWSSAGDATSFNVKRATTSGGPYAAAFVGTPNHQADVIVSDAPVYYFVVTAVNAAGESPNSGELAVSVNGTLPAQVSGLTARADIAKVALTWSAATGATGYAIKRATGGGAYQTVGTTTGTTSFTDTGATNGTTYRYVVAGTNSVGAGPNSDPVSAVPIAPPAEPCSPAQDVTAGQSGSFNTTGPVCKRTTENIAGWGCSSFAGRTVKVNGVLVTCGQTPLPAKANGYYYFDVSAGSYAWASFYWWK